MKEHPWSFGAEYSKIFSKEGPHWTVYCYRLTQLGLSKIQLQRNEEPIYNRNKLAEKGKQKLEEFTRVESELNLESEGQDVRVKLTDFRIMIYSLVMVTELKSYHKSKIQQLGEMVCSMTKNGSLKKKIKKNYKEQKFSQLVKGNKCFKKAFCHLYDLKAYLEFVEVKGTNEQEEELFGLNQCIFENDFIFEPILRTKEERNPTNMESKSFPLDNHLSLQQNELDSNFEERENPLSPNQVAFDYHSSSFGSHSTADISVNFIFKLQFSLHLTQTP